MKKKNTNCQCQKWTRGYHYRANRYWWGRDYIDLKVKAKTIKLPKENRGENF